MSDVIRAYAAAKGFLLETTEGAADDLRLEEVIPPDATKAQVWGLTVSYVDRRDLQPMGVLIAGAPSMRQYRYVDVDPIGFEVKGLRIRETPKTPAG